VGIEIVPLKISYKLGYLKVTLDLPFNLEIQQLIDVKFEFSNFSTFSTTLLQISCDLWGLGEKLLESKMFFVKFHKR